MKVLITFVRIGRERETMNTKQSGASMIGIFIAITIGVFIILLLFLPTLWYLLQKVGMTTDDIKLIETFASTIAAAAVFGAGYIAYRELSEASKSRYLNIADRLFEELNSPENIKARRRIFQNLDPDPEQGIKKLKAEDQDAMKRVLNSLDRVAFLTQPGWIPEDLVMPWMHPMIAKAWEKLEPYVMYERERRKEPYYYKYAEEIAERCRKWRKKHLIEDRINWVDRAL